MKICYLSGSTIPSSLANSIQVMRMCSAFARVGHEVTLVAAPGDAEGAGDDWAEYGVERNFEICYVPRPARRRLGSLLYGRRAARRLRDRKVDLFYGRCPHSLAWSSGRGVPFVYEAHVVPANSLRISLERYLMSRPTFERLVVISDALKAAYLKVIPGLDQSRVIVAHDGADIHKLPGYAELQEPEHGRLKVGYAGALYPGKGMEIVGELAGLAPQHEYHVIGANGPFEAWRRRLAGKVCFHGQVKPRQVPALLSECDVLLLPPQKAVEAVLGGDIAGVMSPLKMFEYMAVARPIIASDLPVIREVLTDGETAILVPPDDPRAWLRALEVIAEDRAFANALARSAWMEVRDRYSWDQRAATVIAGFDSPTAPPVALGLTGERGESRRHA